MTKMTPHPTKAAYERTISCAARLGAERGRKAGGAFVMDALHGYDGFVGPAAAAVLLDGVTNNDEPVLDTLPIAELGGPWSDGLTRQSLVKTALAAGGYVHANGSADLAPAGHAPGQCPVCDWWDATGAISDAYTEAFSGAVRTEVARVAQLQLEDYPPTL